MKYSKKVQRVINYVAAGKDYKRWRFLACFMDSTTIDAKENPKWCNAKDAAERAEKANALIQQIAAKGFKAKIWAPLAHHKSTGHTHVVVLATFREYCALSRVPCRRQIGDYS